MSEPWSDPNLFGAYYGAIVGGGGGTLGGLLGALAGWCVPRRKGRGPILAAMWCFVVLGVLQLAFGLIALSSRQPYGIWYPPLLCGIIFLTVFGVLLPRIKRLYDAVNHSLPPGHP